MDGRYFDSRQLKCHFWDGKTDYKQVRESEDVIQERIDKFGDWLEGQELPDELKIRRRASSIDNNQGHNNNNAEEF